MPARNSSTRSCAKFALIDGIVFDDAAKTVIGIIYVGFHLRPQTDKIFNI